MNIGQVKTVLNTAFPKEKHEFRQFRRYTIHSFSLGSTVVTGKQIVAKMAKQFLF